MQAPAAPRHDLMVRDDARDWTLEQMAAAQWQPAHQPRRAAPRAIANVEEGACASKPQNTLKL